MDNANLAPLLILKENDQLQSTNIHILPEGYEKPGKTPRRISRIIPPLLKQTFVVCGVMLQKTACGAALGYTAILLSALMAQDSPIPTSDEEASWILALFSLGNFSATFISPFVMKYYGRRSSLFLSCLSILAAWILIGTAVNIRVVLLGRFFHGFSNGVQLVALTPYVSETTSPEYRGLFLGTVSLSLSLGKLFSHLVGTFCDWKTTSFICSSLSLGSIIILLLSPESPNYYAGENQFEAAKKSFVWLRGTSQKAREEMEIFINYKMETTRKSTPKSIRSSNIFKTSIKVIKKKEVYKPCFTIFMIYVVYVTSMSEFLSMFTLNLLKLLLNNESDSYIIMNLMDIVRIISSLVGMIVTKKFSRRKVFFSTGTMTVISMLAFSLVSYLIERSYILTSPLLVGIVLNILVFAMSVGTLPITFVYAGELFPLAYKELGGCASTFASGFCFFVMLKTSINLFKFLNIYGFFLLYAAIHSVALIILYYILPETKDKTLVELEKKI